VQDAFGRDYEKEDSSSVLTDGIKIIHFEYLFLLDYPYCFMRFFINRNSWEQSWQHWVSAGKGGSAEGEDIKIDVTAAACIQTEERKGSTCAI
jgi:hypothetical protein